MPRGPSFAKNIKVALGVVVAAALGFATNLIKLEHLPVGVQGFVESSPVLTFFLLLVFAVLLTVATHVLPDTNRGETETTIEFTSPLRTDLLRVLRSRYAHRLGDSLEHEVRLQLGLKDSPGVLAYDPNLRLIGNQEDRPVPPSTSIHRLFEEAGGRLLILGAPGAGKTTMALELAKVLVEKAIANDQEPVPVVVNLASWAEHAGPLRAWLVEALQEDANVNVDLARTLAQGNRLLLLLDGLDEIEASKRAPCIDAINAFLKERAEQIVVTCRTKEYQACEKKLALAKAIQIAPLAPKQVFRALKRVPGSSGLQKMLREDALLGELATTPLMLSVMLLTYKGETAVRVQAETVEVRRQALWDDYVTRMITRRPTAYAPKNILKWLHWLAKNMRQDDMTLFVPDRMQPTWLTRQNVYKWMIPICVALIYGLVFGLIMSLIGKFVFGLVSGLVFGFIYGNAKDSSSIHLEEEVIWSWRFSTVQWKKKIRFGLFAGIVTGLVFGVSWGLGSGLIYGKILGVSFGISIGLLYGLIFPLIEASRTTAKVDKTRTLGERLKASHQNGWVYAQIVGWSSALIFGLMGWTVFNDIGFVLSAGLMWGLFWGLTSGLSEKGGGEALKFDVLRWLLVREGAIPWHYFRFLRTVSDLLMLHQVGGAVQFRHLLLRDYFADLTPAHIDELAVRIPQASRNKL